MIKEWLINLGNKVEDYACSMKHASSYGLLFFVWLDSNEILFFEELGLHINFRLIRFYTLIFRVGRKGYLDGVMPLKYGLEYKKIGMKRFVRNRAQRNGVGMG